MIQVQCRHYLIETEDKNLADNAVAVAVDTPTVPRKDDAKLKSLLDQTDGPSDGNDYWMGKK